MSASGLRTSDISLPVLQKSTSARVSSALNQQHFYTASDDDDDLPAPPPELLRQYDDNVHNLIDQEPQQLHQNQQHSPGKSEILNQQQEEEEASQRLLSKYASPDNIFIPQSNNDFEDSSTLTNKLNAHLSITDNKEFPSSVDHHVKKSKGTSSVSAFSDTSSDVSDATTSVPSATSIGSVPAPIPAVEGATDNDIQQADMFYRSQKTDVRVCQSLANMYLSATKTLERMPAGQGDSPTKSPDPTEMSMEDWDFIKTGIPVLVLNTGEHLRGRKLSIILAEKGTGFSLWQDELNSSTLYRTPHSNFHTLSLSTDPSRLVGFSFDEAKAAAQFADELISLLPRPDDNLNNDKKKKKKKEKKPKQKYKPPKKNDISQPCCFVHVTKLERPSIMGLPSSLFPPPPSGVELSQAMLRSQSQSSDLSEYSTSASEH